MHQPALSPGRCIVLILSLLVLVTACQTSAETEQLPDVYFDVKGFVENQIVLLNKQKPTIEKTMVVGTDKETRRTNEVNWQRELELFIQADLNKPAFRQSYGIAQPDPLTFEYTIKTEEDLPVRYLKVVLDQPNGRPTLIEAKVVAKNKLYESEKNLLMRCAEQAGAWRVSVYEIKGFQELVISDRKPFDVRVAVQ